MIMANSLEKSYKEFPRVSGNGNYLVSLTRLLEGYDVPANGDLFDALNNRAWFDPLNERVVRAFSTVYSELVVPYEGPITTLSMTHYGTTSAWWIILAYNGFVHPDDIEEGTSVRIPELAPIVEALSDDIRRVRRIELVQI